MQKEIINLVLIIVLILLNAYFVLLEFAIVQVRSSQIDTLLQDKKNKRAKKCKLVKDNINAYLSSTQLGITLVGLLLGWIGEPTVSNVIEPILTSFNVGEGLRVKIAFVVSFALITLMEVVFGELIPKAVAIDKAEKCSLIFCSSLVVFHKLTYPITATFDKITELCLKPLGIELKNENEEVFTKDELELLINQSIQDQREQILFSNVFKFSNKTLKEIMVHRINMVCINKNDSQDKVLEIITNNGYTRYPVIDKDKDDIVGFIHVRDIYEEIVTHNNLEIDKCLREISSFNEETKIRDAFKDLKEKKEQIAIVVDSFNGTSGLVTLEDIIEELVGEIEDEFDEEQYINEVDENSYVVSGIAPLEIINKNIGTTIVSNSCETIGQWLIIKLGNDVKEGKSLVYDSYEFKITKYLKPDILSISVVKLDKKDCLIKAKE